MEYQTLIKQTQDTIRSDKKTADQWVTVGASARDFFGTETAMNEVKAQFIADAIIPALDKKHAQALARELPRKGSADYVAYVANHGAALWEDQNKAKKDARATAHTYFARIVKYAWPTEKTERTPTPLQTRIMNEVSALIKACQKTEAVDFDVARTIAALDAVLVAAMPTHK